jgi:cell division protease FtsH
VTSVVILPQYYSDLLAWALQRYIEQEGWRIVRAVGYHHPEPAYTDVDTGPDQRQNVLRNGTMLVERGGDRFAITIDAGMYGYNNVVVTGMEQSKEKVEQFARGLENLAKEKNFYRGKKLEFSGGLRFLKLPSRSWSDIVLDPGVKQEIWDNTVGFLLHRNELAEYGIPAKRGVILHGSPGTGKTLVCRLLMAESQDITCIIISASAMEHEYYLSVVYELAQQLAPTITFIEDIDAIAQDRMEYGCNRGPALLTLLSLLDGIEERKEIVTVATTNFPEVLDKAIGRRPSRFDRIVEIPEPDLGQRKQFIKQICQKIPVGADIQGYIAHRTEKMTPAQIQEVIYSLVISCRQDKGNDDCGCLRLGTETVDRAIAKLNGKKQQQLGFIVNNNHNGHHDEIFRVQK